MKILFHWLWYEQTQIVVEAPVGFWEEGPMFVEWE